MITSDVDLCSLGLSFLGIAPITSITDPESNEEFVCAKWFDITLKEALGEATPNFAIKRCVLAKDATDPIFGYKNRYLMPNDLVRFLSIGSAVENTTTSYDIEGSYLLTDEGGDEGLQVRYLYKNTNVVEYDAEFVKYLTMLLAYNMSFDLNNDQQQRQVLEVNARTALRISRIKSRQDGKVLMVKNSKYINSRYGGTGEIKFKK